MKKKILSFATRPNLKYPLQYMIYCVLRDIEQTLIENYLNFSDSLMYTPLMFIGEFFGGLIVYLYQKKFIEKKILKDACPNKLVNILLKKAEKRVKIIDTKPKIIFIIFCCSFFDFIQFVISINAPQFINVSASVSTRLGEVLIIFDALFYYFALKLPLKRHQIFSLIVLSSCLLIVIITEFIFQEINIFISYLDFIHVFLLSFSGRFFGSMVDANEKYLFEYDNLNPFYALLFEGLFGFLLSVIYNIFYNPFEKINEIKKNKTSSEFGILIFCLIIYVILSGLKNLFRVNTTKIFTPMTTASSEFILNPIYFIIDFVLGNDFIKKGKRNYAYFLINIIISIIISFFCLVFNEFAILYICDLDKDTHLQISKRSEIDETFNNFEELYIINDNNSFAFDINFMNKI